MVNLKKILLVEDNDRDLELTLLALEEHHLANDVIIARDGEEALAALEGKSNGELPAFVLLDLKLPKIDGLEVLNRIRSNPSLKYLPVIILTSSREEQDLVRSYELGVNAFVVKPVDFNDFISRVKELGMFWAVINETPPKKGTEA